SSPNTRLYIARCLHQLGRNAEALLEYQHAAAEAADRAVSESRYAATRDAARSEAATIEPLVGRLLIHADEPPEGLVVTADGNAVPSALLGLAAPSDPHEVVVSARAPGYMPFEQRVSVQAGQETEVQIRLERAASVSSAPPPVQMVTVREGGTVRLAGFV